MTTDSTPGPRSGLPESTPPAHRSGRQLDRPLLDQAPPDRVDDDDIAEAVVEAGLRDGGSGQAVGEMPHGLVYKMGEVPVAVPCPDRYPRVLDPVTDKCQAVVGPVVVDLA